MHQSIRKESVASVCDSPWWCQRTTTGSWPRAPTCLGTELLLSCRRLRCHRGHNSNWLINDIDYFNHSRQKHSSESEYRKVSDEVFTPDLNNSIKYSHWADLWLIRGNSSHYNLYIDNIFGPNVNNPDDLVSCLCLFTKIKKLKSSLNYSCQSSSHDVSVEDVSSFVPVQPPEGDTDGEVIMSL